MTPERLADFDRLIDELKLRFARWERIDIPGEKPMYNFYDPNGVEVRDLLDQDHMPNITRFNTICLSAGFADLRGVSTEEGPGTAEEVGGDPRWLETMSGVAADSDNYGPTEEARENRKKDRQQMAKALAKAHEADPISDDDVMVGVARCGDNLCEELGIKRKTLTAKRLRWAGSPDLLGAGVNLKFEEATVFEGKRVRLQEGVVASGSTEIAIILAILNVGVRPRAVDCDAAVVCPAGADFVAKFKDAVGIKGRDKGAFVGGQLNENWYVEYGPDDRLFKKLRHLGDKALAFIGKQVIGDGGDLTSNV